MDQHERHSIPRLQLRRDQLRRGQPVRGGRVTAKLAAVLSLSLWASACGGAARGPVGAAEAPTTPAPAPVNAASPPLPAVYPPITAAPPQSPAVHGVVSAARGAANAYEGVWAGTSIRQQCHEAGGAVGVACRSVPDEQKLHLRLTQVGSRARGVLELGSVRADVSGAVGADGTLSLSGARSDATHTITVTDWRSTTNGLVMNGSFAFSITPADSRLGTVTISAVIDGMVKGS